MKKQKIVKTKSVCCYESDKHFFLCIIHESVAYVIGKRRLGLIDKLPKEYCNRLSTEHRQLPRLNQWAKAYRYTHVVNPANIFPAIGKTPKVDCDEALPF